MAHLHDGTNAVIASRAWTIPSTQIVQPNERVEFAGCCVSDKELEHTVLYSLTFTFTSLAC